MRQAKRAMDVMGHTLSHSQKLFEHERKTEIEFLCGDGEEEKINTLMTEFTFQSWVRAVKKYAAVVARDEYVDGHFPLLEKERAIMKQIEKYTHRCHIIKMKHSLV